MPGHGRYYEDFAAGDISQHPVGRTISETDNTSFTLLTMKPKQNHLSAEFAARAPSRQLIVSSAPTVAIVPIVVLGSSSPGG